MGVAVLEERRRLRLSSVSWWRSPEGQPSWARPALLALTAVAGFLYAWQATGNLEVYYAAAVRIMSMSWHNFFFAAFDPAGTITVDKLPGTFWVQALSVRLFGVHAWAIIAPQFHIVIQAPKVTDPRLEWVAGHCLPLGGGRGGASAAGGLRFAIYYCGRPQLF